MADTRHHGHHGGPAGTEHPGVGTEDVNIVAISKLGIGLTILCVASAFLIWGVFAYLKHQTDAIQAARPAAPGLNLDVRRRPPDPTLQESPILDLEDMRAAEDAILNGYSKSGETVHIPIGQAMDIVAGQNLPARPQAPQPQVPVDTYPNDSGMGYIMQQPGGPLNPNREQPAPQKEEIHGTGNMRDGRQAGGPPTPPVQQHAPVQQGKQK